MSARREMKKGDRVRVTGTVGTITGTVVDACRTVDLPAVDIPESDAARELLRNGFDLIALVEYAVLHHHVIFAALRDHGGAWWDIHGQALEVELAGENTAGRQC